MVQLNVLVVTPTFLNYDEATKGKTMTEKKEPSSKPIVNPHGADYSALTDRRISEATAKKYGVKCVLSSNGDIVQHLYPITTSMNCLH